MVGEQQCLIDMTIIIVLYGWANFLCSDSSIIFSWKKSSREKEKERKTEDGEKNRAGWWVNWMDSNSHLLRGSLEGTACHWRVKSERDKKRGESMKLRKWNGKDREAEFKRTEQGRAKNMKMETEMWGHKNWYACARHKASFQTRFSL